MKGGDDGVGDEGNGQVVMMMRVRRRWKLVMRGGDG